MEIGIVRRTYGCALELQFRLQLSNSPPVFVAVLHIEAGLNANREQLANLAAKKVSIRHSRPAHRQKSRLYIVVDCIYHARSCQESKFKRMLDFVEPNLAFNCHTTLFRLRRAA